LDVPFKKSNFNLTSTSESRTCTLPKSRRRPLLLCHLVQLFPEGDCRDGSFHQALQVYGQQAKFTDEQMGYAYSMEQVLTSATAIANDAC
jgi:hypothetical protein